MAQAKGLKQGKTKSFTFRITADLANDIAKVKRDCKDLGVSWNITDVLTDALERELKAVQKHIQSSS